MPEQLNLVHVQNPNEIQSPENAPSGFIPEPIHLEIPGVFETHIFLAPVVLDSVGQGQAPHYRELLGGPARRDATEARKAQPDSETYTSFRNNILNEVKRSKEGVMVPDDPQEIASGMQYDELHKTKQPIPDEMVMGKREAAQKIIAEHKGTHEELVEKLRASSQEFISEEQRFGYTDNMKRTNKYSLQGAGDDGEFPYYWDAQSGELHVSLKTSKRTFAGYKLYGKTDLDPEIQDLGKVYGTVSTLAVDGGKQYLIIKRSNSNIRYKGPGLFGGMFDDQGGPISNDAVARNSGEEIFQELGIHPSQLIDRRITSLSFDHIAPHGEVTEAAVTNLTEQEIIGIIDSNAQKAESRNNESREKDYFFIPRTSEALKVLLVDIKSPLPPTHISALLADSGVLRYQEQVKFYLDLGVELQKSNELAYKDAKAFLESMAPGIAQNMEQINKIAGDHWINNPNAWQEFIESEKKDAEDNNTIPLKRSDSPPTKYDPSIPDELQGFDSLKDQILQTGLTTEDKLHGPLLAAA